MKKFAILFLFLTSSICSAHLFHSHSSEDLDPETVLKMTQNEIFKKIEAKETLIRELRQELESSERIVTDKGIFYPIPKIGKFVSGFFAGTSLIQTLLSFPKYEKYIRANLLHAVSWSLAALAFSYLDQPKVSVIELSEVDKIRLEAGLSELERQVESLRAAVQHDDHFHSH